MSPFDSIGNIPFDLSVLSSLFPQNRCISDKARKLESDGRILRLKKVFMSQVRTKQEKRFLVNLLQIIYMDRHT